MAINLKTTGSLAASGVKILVYGEAGAGKTRLINTLPSPLILSAEGGLLSLKEFNLPYLVVESIDDVKEAFEWILNHEDAKQFKTIAIDSISEIAESCLNYEKKNKADPRQAYGEMNEQLADLIRAFRGLPDRHVYMTAKVSQEKDEMGRLLYSPDMPGKRIAKDLPYFFDEVLALRVEKDAEGVTHRALLTDSDSVWKAKDRSGTLETWEAPDLGAIIKKINGEVAASSEDQDEEKTGTKRGKKNG